MKDKIFAICEQLTEQNIRPTLENVRKELGGGSFSTINPILKQWKESQTHRPAQIVEIPPEAEKAVKQATALIWSIATEHQAEAINAITAEATRIEQAAIAERDEALTEIQTLEGRIKELESNLEATNKTNTRLDMDNQVLIEWKNRLENEQEKEQIRLDFVTESKDKAEAEVKDLKAQNACQAEEINALRLKVTTQQLSLDANAQAIEQHQAEAEQLKEEIKKAETQEKAQAKELNSLSLQNQKLQTALDSSSKALDEIKAEAKESRQELKQAQNEAAKLAGMLEIYEKTAKNK